MREDMNAQKFGAKNERGTFRSQWRQQSYYREGLMLRNDSIKMKRLKVLI